MPKIVANKSAITFGNIDMFLFNRPILSVAVIPMQHLCGAWVFIGQSLKLSDNTGVVGADGRHLSIVEPVNLRLVHSAPL